ncbi:MAG: hypothetical protein HQL22_11205 [Candidatus Omnitrophica bacterium]|nr:hypothetical protein [Candidatus Omnitrophota bacterium]
MKKLTSKIIKVSQTNDDLLNAMFHLMDQDYAGVTLDKMKRDLSNKQYLLLLSDEAGQLRGFTTMQIFDSYSKGHAVKIMYSGDTVISSEFRGELELMRAWWRFVCMLGKEHPGIDLYWMLISKGWRTYKFLPLFFKEFYPNRSCETPKEFREFIDRLGTFKFPKEYKKGLVTPQQPDFLRSGMSDIPVNRKNDADVIFFLEKNPDFYKGTELVCVTKLHSANLTRTGFRAAYGEKK